MECSIYDSNLNRVGVVSTWVSMIWAEGYNSLGSFQIELQQRNGLIDLFSIDRFCGIPDSDTLMILKSVQVRNGTIVANGFPATRILGDRVSTAVISNRNSELAMRSLVQNMSPWPGVELGEVAGINDVFAPQKSDASILEYCQIIGQYSDVGFKLRHDKVQRKLLFECYKPPENPNARYSTDYGNVGSLEYSMSAINYKNVAVVAGAGEGAARITVTVGTASGADRREMYVDARQEQPEEGEAELTYMERLSRIGQEKLVEQVKASSLSFKIEDNRAKLGDVIFCRFPEIGVQTKVRITGKTIKSQKNGTEVTATLGTPIIVRRY